MQPALGPDPLSEIDVIGLEARCYGNHVQLDWSLLIFVFLLLHLLVGEVFVPRHIYQLLHVGVVDDATERVEFQLHVLEHGLIRNTLMLPMSMVMRTSLLVMMSNTITTHSPSCFLGRRTC